VAAPERLALREVLKSSISFGGPEEVAMVSVENT
jgi:hypothetical protein